MFTRQVWVVSSTTQPPTHLWTAEPVLRHRVLFREACRCTAIKALLIWCEAMDFDSVATAEASRKAFDICQAGLAPTSHMTTGVTHESVMRGFTAGRLHTQQNKCVKGAFWLPDAHQNLWSRLLTGHAAKACRTGRQLRLAATAFCALDRDIINQILEFLRPSRQHHLAAKLFVHHHW